MQVKATCNYGRWALEMYCGQKDVEELLIEGVLALQQTADTEGMRACFYEDAPDYLKAAKATFEATTFAKGSRESATVYITVPLSMGEVTILTGYGDNPTEA